MNNNQHSNGNPALNASRESINVSISRYGNLGKSKKLQWEKSRRFRTI